MQNFWTFYQNMGPLSHPFRVFGPAHLGYVLAAAAVILAVLKAYRRQDEAGKRKWQRVVAVLLILQEIAYYGWVAVGCRENRLFELLSLELCTVCVFTGFSTLFHENKQVRFFSALMGLLGAPVAIAYPATVSELYPSFCYRLIQFYTSHGLLVLFALMVLSDAELLTKARLWKNIAIAAGMLLFAYVFNRIFGTQYMFVGNPPQISIIRLVYDLTGPAFLFVAIGIFSGYQVLLYAVVKKLQRVIYCAK